MAFVLCGEKEGGDEESAKAEQRKFRRDQDKISRVSHAEPHRRVTERTGPYRSIMADRIKKIWTI